MVFDVAVIGAGMAGLTCAQQLRQAGYAVVLLEKSRGVGGRVATRRLYGTVADHGARYLEPQGAMVQQLIRVLCDRHLAQLWTEVVYEWGEGKQLDAGSGPCYVAPAGMNAVGKFLANGLEIWLNRRVAGLAPTSEATWHLTLETAEDSTSVPGELQAKAVVVAIPAPQALMLLAAIAHLLPTELVDKLQSIEYAPTLTVMAGYPPERQLELAQRGLKWKAVSFPHHPELGWIGLDSSKRLNSQQPVMVVQSSAAFAQKHLEAPDLGVLGQQLLDRSAESLIPWLNSPEWLQVHRWRYAFCHNPLPVSCLTATSLFPLVCAGDWCGGNQIEGALRSGIAAAIWVNSQLQQLPLPAESFWSNLSCPAPPPHSPED
ncbi:MAG: NAD(P)/FAD-dependent oxidoreductase [Actinomycetota bacterium]